MFEFDGLSEMIESLKAWRDKVQTDAIPAIQQRWIEIVQNAAVDTVPVDTGFLQNSIHPEQDSSTTVSVVADAPYAGFVEFGTSKMRAQPYLEPAAAEAESQIEDIMIEELGNAMQ